MNSTLPQLTSFDDAPRLDLLYGWEFLADVTGKLRLPDLAETPGWRVARVGVSWNAQFVDLRDYMGVGWYRTKFRIPTYGDDRHILIKFGAVDYFAEVFLNGRRIGSHEGGYTPFHFEITEFLQPGDNELVVRVIDPPMDEALNQELCPEMMYNEIPHGKQNWYIQNAGIWQGVRLELCPAIYVENIRITPNISGDLKIDVQLAGAGLESAEVSAATSLHVSVQDSSGKVEWETQVQGPTTLSSKQLHAHVRNHRLWSPDSPALYTVEVSVTGAVQYRKRVRFGFRKFEARDQKLFLNNKPFYLMGALDQDFYPETIHTPASEAYVRDTMLKAKAMGINLLRCHLKVAHPVYLTVADEVGLLLWTEMPSWSDCWYPADHFSHKAADRGRKMFEEVLDRDWNHPSIVIQTIMNESWGIDLQQAEQRTWLKETFNRIKEEVAPLGRLVVDNSACEKNFHLKSDIEDFHNYYSMPDDAAKWDKWTAELASRPAWTFSPFGDAERTGHEPILVSEFGNWGLPKLPDEVPWWFHCSFGGREVTTPVGVLERFTEYGLDRVFGSYDAFAEETQWHQFSSLKHQMEDIRKHGEIQGHVVTGMTDVHWEVNGLLDMWRDPKVFSGELERLQKPDLILIDIAKQNFTAGETVDFEVILSHYSTTDVKGSRLRWATDSGLGGQFTISESIPSGTVRRLQHLSFTAPELALASSERIHMELRSAKGAVIAQNSAELFLFPQAEANIQPLRLHDPLGTSGGLGEQLRNAGYTLRNANDHRPEELMIATQLDTIAKAHAASGGPLLLLLDSPAGLPSDLPWTVAAREGSDLDGRWFSNFNWINPDSELYKALWFTRVLGFESRHVVPRHIIRPASNKDFTDVLSGVAFGWIAKNSALTQWLRLPQGLAFATTYRFDQYSRDPYATHLLNNMITVAQQRQDISTPEFSVSTSS
ncbi:MAG: putative glycoside hydrolase [Acidobacteriales bacterium]|nr:putative glycoside hydrolase [Terriglobales bacterium]